MSLTGTTFQFMYTGLVPVSALAYVGTKYNLCRIPLNYSSTFISKYEEMPMK